MNFYNKRQATYYHLPYIYRVVKKKLFTIGFHIEITLIELLQIQYGFCASLADFQLRFGIPKCAFCQTMEHRN